MHLAIRVPLDQFAPTRIIAPISLDWCKLVSMRLTVKLDSDVYSFTSAYAGAKGITLSAAIGELVRRAEQVPESNSPKLKMNEFGYLEIAETGNRLTPERVKRASEDELVR